MKKAFIISLAIMIVMAFCFINIPMSKADTYTDLSASVPNIGVIDDIAWNGSYWLITGDDTNNLYKYDGTTFNNLTPNIPDTVVHAVAWNGSYWLIGGSKKSDVNSEKLYSYDGVNFTDLTLNVPGLGKIWSISWNGLYWLIGGYGTNKLYSYDGVNFTDLSASLSELSGVESIAWNGSYWLIGGEPVSYPGSNLYSYDGATFTDLSSGMSNVYEVRSISWNGSYWLISLANDVNTLYSYDGVNFNNLTSNVPGFISIDSTVWNASYWLLGGSPYSSGNPMLYFYDGTTFTNLTDKVPNEYIYSIAWNGSYWLIGGTSLYRFDHLYINNIYPSSAANNQPITITINGTAFDNVNPGVTVKLTKQGQSDINATNVTVTSSTQITCTLPITGATPGVWSLVVTNPDSQSTTMTNALTITTHSTPATPTELPYTGL